MVVLFAVLCGTQIQFLFFIEVQFSSYWKQTEPNKLNSSSILCQILQWYIMWLFVSMAQYNDKSIKQFWLHNNSVCSFWILMIYSKTSTAKNQGQTILNC